MKKYVIGITGGIASGKTLVTDILAELGAYIVDADVLSREVTRMGSEGDRKLCKEFPLAYHNGVLNRAILREEIFSDPKRRKRLNAITHPLIKQAAKKYIKNAPDNVVFFAVPLLFESGFDKLCHYTVTVHADIQERINRLKKRNTDISDQTAINMVMSQMSDARRIGLADEVIVNSGTVEELRASVVAFYEKIRQKFSR